jgi:hypothetical protein
LVLVDEEDRRYFKQQEIILWRKGEKTRKPFQASLQQQYKQMQNPNVQFASSDQSIGSSSKSSNPLGSSNKDGETNNEGEAVTRTTKDYRSPLEQGSSSEEAPTPDKEFQSVINSKDVNSPTSPEVEDNPILQSKDNNVPTSIKSEATTVGEDGRGDDSVENSTESVEVKEKVVPQEELVEESEPVVVKIKVEEEKVEEVEVEVNPKPEEQQQSSSTQEKSKKQGKKKSKEETPRSAQETKEQQSKDKRKESPVPAD